MTEEVLLNLGNAPCRILIGQGILTHAGALIAEGTPFRRFAVITNPAVNALYGDTLVGSLAEAGLDCMTLEISDSETSKSLETANRLYGELAGKGFDRDSCMIGLGGGTVGDLAGFVAATYLRGIGLIHVPTTLLAQVDSSVGGKTAVNIPEGKNLVGAFHQPRLVISDVSTLRTLSDADFRSGLAEIVKCGIISKDKIFRTLEENRSRILDRDPAILEELVYKCVGFKAAIVGKDERDLGIRAILNLGHTLGHALEAASDYSYSHGAAVSIGTVFAARVSVRFGLMSEHEILRISNLLASFGLPVSVPAGTDADAILGFMKADKKAKRGETMMILPAGTGREPVCENVARETLLETLEEMRR